MLLTYPDWTRRFIIGRGWLTRVETAACDWMMTHPDRTPQLLWLTQTEHGGLWWELTHPDWTRHHFIGCWLTQTEHGGLWFDVGSLRLNTAVYDWMLLTYLDWTRRFIIGRGWLTRVETAACDWMMTHPDRTPRLLWLTQTEHGGLWWELTHPDWTRHHFIGYGLLRQNIEAWDWILTHPDWTRGLLIGYWLTQTEHGGLWWDVDSPKLKTASFYRMLTYPNWTWRFMIRCCWLTRVGTAACDRMLTHP